MTTYPGEIDEFRVAQNLPGILYNAADTKTVYAEDTNSHSDAIVAIETTLGVNPQGDFDTVADRLAAGGGGGGSWEFVTRVNADGFSDALEVTTLDIATDKCYWIFFDVFSSADVIQGEFSGSSGITPSVKGIKYTSSGSTNKSGLDNFSHPSLGHGVGTMLLSATRNNAVSIKIDYQIGSSQWFDLRGQLGNEFSSNTNLTTVRFEVGGFNAISNDSYISVYRRVE